MLANQYKKLGNQSIKIRQIYKNVLIYIKYLNFHFVTILINLKSQFFFVQHICYRIYILYKQIDKIQSIIISFQKNDNRMAGLQLKQGNVYTFEVHQNSTKYIVRLAITSKGLWMNIQESFMQWKLTISQQLALQTVAKATANKQIISYKQIISAIVSALQKQSQRWTIGIMTPIQLEMLRGGNGSKHSSNNKIYLILSDKNKKLHFPFTFTINDVCEKDKLIQAIKVMKDQLNQLRISDKSQTSFSIMTDENNLQGEQLKMQNQQLKKKIKIYEQSLTQKRGAVEIDNILRQKNMLQIQVQTKKRQQTKQITRLKNVYSLMDRQITQLRTQVDLINRQLLLLQDSMGNPAKLKSHAMRVLKSYQLDLRTSKKVLQKQTKDIEALKRNIATSKNNQRKHITKIKQIQTQIQQAKKKANVKQISNRLHSPGSSKKGDSSVGGGSLKAPSVASDQSDSKKKFNNKIGTNNLVRQNLLKKTSDQFERERSRSNTGAKNSNQLMKTTPNIKGSPSIPRKTQYKPPPRPVVSSHNMKNQDTRNSPAIRQKSKQNDFDSSKSLSESKKKQMSTIDKEKQKQLIQRLTGGSGSRSKGAIATSSSNKNITKPNPKTSIPKKDNTKDILNRMKEVRAQYNSRSKNSAAKQQGIAAKVAELTSQKKLG